MFSCTEPYLKVLLSSRHTILARRDVSTKLAANVNLTLHTVEHIIITMNSNLTEEEKHIMFAGGTEAPFSGALLDEKRSGEFVCKNCGHVLFGSSTKFESGTGWPSFTEPANRENVVLKEDTSHGMARTEVTCANCAAHLGHVFEDGPKDKGGQRYCINSACLAFNPEEPDGN